MFSFITCNVPNECTKLLWNIWPGGSVARGPVAGEPMWMFGRTCWLARHRTSNGQSLSSNARLAVLYCTTRKCFFRLFRNGNTGIVASPGASILTSSGQQFAFNWFYSDFFYWGLWIISQLSGVEGDCRIKMKIQDKNSTSPNYWKLVTPLIFCFSLSYKGLLKNFLPLGYLSDTFIIFLKYF